jgi:hypothetical protein
MPFYAFVQVYAVVLLLQLYDVLLLQSLSVEQLELHVLFLFGVSAGFGNGFNAPPPRFFTTTAVLGLSTTLSCFCAARIASRVAVALFSGWRRVSSARGLHLFQHAL